MASPGSWIGRRGAPPRPPHPDLSRPCDGVDGPFPIGKKPPEGTPGASSRATKPSAARALGTGAGGTVANRTVKTSTPGHREENDGRRDVARAVEEMAERLPPPLSALARVAYNYLWSWLPHGEAVFRDIDPALWRRSGCNPRLLIEAVAPR